MLSSPPGSLVEPICLPAACQVPSLQDWSLYMQPSVTRHETMKEEETEKDTNDDKHLMKNANAYYDNDFPWQDVALKRRKMCQEQERAMQQDEMLDFVDPKVSATVWEEFYQRNSNKFFKPKAYLNLAFPMISDTCSNVDCCKLFEIGCGTGSALLPLLKKNNNLQAVGYDVSKHAIECLSSVVNKNEEIKARCEGAVFDALQQDIPQALVGTFDFSLLCFTLSAIPPQQHRLVVEKAATVLKSGGKLLFRDYGLYDLVQTRCKKRLGKNHYVKQDGVQCYFYSTEAFQELVESCDSSLKVDELKYCTVRNINRKKNQNIDRVFLHAVVIKI